MNLTVAFPDVEALCVAYLNRAFIERDDSARTSTQIPADRPDRFVRITRMGGRRINVAMDSPLMVFECWDTTAPDAESLGQLTRALVGAMDEYGSEVGGLAYFPDPDTILPRYQFTVQLFTKGVEL